jgi:hypothetical protein
MKNLQNFGVQEMNAEEIREIEGGRFEFGIFWAGLDLRDSVFEELGHFWEGFQNGFKATTK